MARIVPVSEVTFDKKTSVTVGTFDGVHAGHQSLIQVLCDEAKKCGARSVLVTFDPHPRDIINPQQSLGLLTTLEERAEMFGKLGLDEMVVIPFTRDFSLLSSHEFIMEYIVKKIGLSCFVIGYDHHFGRDRKGSYETVVSIGKQENFSVRLVQAHEIATHTVSSTAVRKALLFEGDVSLANTYLGHPYRIVGTVVNGDQRGRTIGFPTANIKPENPKKIVPKNGVYVVKAEVLGETYFGMMNIGNRPTVTLGEERTIEVHLFDFNKMIYGKTMKIEFLARLRDEIKFNGIDALIEQINKDKLKALRVIQNNN
jgi:riboflavin kinase/FMN adenylyltransferase